MNEHEHLLTAEEAANRLQCSKAHLYRLASRGQLRSIPHAAHSLRFHPAELASYQAHIRLDGTQLRLAKPASRKARLHPSQRLLHPDTLTAPEAARFLGMKLDTFYWQLRAGKLPLAFTRAGARGKRFRLDDLQHYAQAHGITPVAIPGVDCP